MAYDVPCWVFTTATRSFRRVTLCGWPAATSGGDAAMVEAAGERNVWIVAAAAWPASRRGGTARRGDRDDRAASPSARALRSCPATSSCASSSSGNGEFAAARYSVGRRRRPDRLRARPHLPQSLYDTDRARPVQHRSLGSRRPALQTLAASRVAARRRRSRWSRSRRVVVAHRHTHVPADAAGVICLVGVLGVSSLCGSGGGSAPASPRRSPTTSSSCRRPHVHHQHVQRLGRSGGVRSDRRRHLEPGIARAPRAR